MHIGWWQGGLHIEPESEKDRLALVAISEALGFDKPLEYDRYMIHERNKNEEIIAIDVEEDEGHGNFQGKG